MRRFVLLLLVPGSAIAAEPQPPGNPLLDQVITCLDIAEVPARVACYDANVRKLAEASRAQSIVVVDREEIRRTRRSLFGFKLPRIRLFGEDTKDSARAAAAEEITKLEGTIRAVRTGRDGRYVLTLDDDASWQITDDAVAIPPRPGQAIVIRRGAMGSFLANIAGRRAVRLQRIG